MTPTYQQQYDAIRASMTEGPPRYFVVVAVETQVGTFGCGYQEVSDPEAGPVVTQQTRED
jgi:hypothetical protein